MQYRAIAVKQNDKKSEEGTPDPRTILYNEQPQHLANLGDVRYDCTWLFHVLLILPFVVFAVLIAKPDSHLHSSCKSSGEV